MNELQALAHCCDWWPNAGDPYAELDQVKHLAAWCLSDRYSIDGLARVVALVERPHKDGYVFATALYDLIGWPPGMGPECATASAWPHGKASEPAEVER